MPSAVISVHLDHRFLPHSIISYSTLFYSTSFYPIQFLLFLFSEHCYLLHLVLLSPPHYSITLHIYLSSFRLHTLRLPFYLLHLTTLLLSSTPSPTSTFFAAIASQMLMDYISGRLGGHTDVTLASRIVRVIIAGNSVVTGDIAKGKDRYATFYGFHSPLPYSVTQQLNSAT